MQTPALNGFILLHCLEVITCKVLFFFFSTSLQDHPLKVVRNQSEHGHLKLGEVTLSKLCH